MKISEYIKNYTAGNRWKLRYVFDEIIELLYEIIKFNKLGIKEEWQDVLHGFQLWIYWTFKFDQEIWSQTSDVVKKFIERHNFWKEIYKSAGLKENVSNYYGNYNRLEKVIKQLERFNISKEKAEEVYKKIVLNKVL